MEPTPETIAAINAAYGTPTSAPAPEKVTETPPAETPKPETLPAKSEESPKPEKTVAKPEKKATVDPLEALGADDDEEDAPKDDRLPIDDEEAEEEEEAPAGDKAFARFKELKDNLKTVKTEKLQLQQDLAAREARIQELEGSKPELEQLRQKVAEYETEMSVAKLERTEAYKAQVAEPLQKIVDEASEIAEKYGIDEAKLFKALETSDKKVRRELLKEATSGLDIDPDDAYAVRKLAEDVQPLLEKEKTMKANAEQALAELELRRGEEAKVQAAERAQEREKATLIATGKMAEKLPFFKDIIAEVAEQAKTVDPEQLKPLNQGYNIAAGLALPKIAKAYRDLQKQLDDALSEIDTKKRTEPKIGGAAPSGSEFTMPTSLADAVNRGLAKK